MRVVLRDIKNTTSNVLIVFVREDVYTSFLNSLGAAHAYLSAPLLVILKERWSKEKEVDLHRHSASCGIIPRRSPLHAILFHLQPFHYSA